MKAVTVSVIWAVMLGGQVPVAPAPELPFPQGRAAEELNKPPLLVPASPPSRQVTGPPTLENGTKPPPFRLIDANPPPENVSLKTATTLSVVEPGRLAGFAVPCLQLARTGPATVKAKEPFTYEIVARNTGTVAAGQVKLEEELPPGTRFVTAQPMPMAVGDHLAWTVESLPPGSERHFTVEVEASRDGEWKATATLSVSVSSSMKADVTGGPQSMLSLIGPGTLPVGHPVAFQIRVVNTSQATLTDPILRVQMAPGLQHLHGDAIEASLGDLAPGQSREVTLEAVTLQIGRLSAEATLMCGKKTIAAAEAVTVTTEQPALALRQTGPLSPPVGGEHEYKLEVTNRTASELQDVEVSDVLPEGLQFIGAVQGQYDGATRTIRWNIGTMLPGQVRHVVFRAQIHGAGPQINRISARATGVAEAKLHTILRLGGAR